MVLLYCQISTGGKDGEEEEEEEEEEEKEERGDYKPKWPSI